MEADLDKVELTIHMEAKRGLDKAVFFKHANTKK
jgi:hypothetical protein